MAAGLLKADGVVVGSVVEITPGMSKHVPRTAPTRSGKGEAGGR
jgi:hypothetical protein